MRVTHRKPKEPFDWRLFGIVVVVGLGLFYFVGLLMGWW